MAVGWHERRRSLFKTIAYASRYGHAPPNVTMNMPLPDLYDFVSAVNELIGEESEAMRNGASQ